MDNNTPTLMQSEEEKAPWNQKTKTISVVISQMLSCETTLEVPEDFEYDPIKLEDYARKQVTLPFDVMLKHSNEFWAVDDFCVM